MSIVVNTNMSALRAQNSLNKASWSMNQSLERLTTGKRINSAKDDPAGLYVASGMSSQLRGIKIANQNVSIANNMLEIAAGDLTAINSQVERIKDLATQFANSTLSTEEQEAIREEVSQRIDEINRIAADSNFNQVNLLDGSKAGGLRIQIGPNSDAATNSLTIDGVFANANAASINLIGGSSAFASVDEAFASATAAAQFIDIVQASADDITKRISTAGIYQSRLSSVSDSLSIRSENLTSAHSTVMDADIAEETSNYIKHQLLAQTSSSLLVQANQMEGMIALSLINSMG